MIEPEVKNRLAAGEDPLDLAIEKWVDIREGRGEDFGSDNCALCIAYIHCSACPVRAKTGWGGCDKTPYGSWRKHQRDIHGGIFGYFACECPKCEAIADEEIAFLRALKGKTEKE